MRNRTRNMGTLILTHKQGADLNALKIQEKCLKKKITI